MKVRQLLAVLVALVLALAASACGGDDDEDGGGGGGGGGTETQAEGGDGNVAGDESVSGNVQLSGVWTGPEQKSFQAVLDGFNKKFPNVKVKYNSTGDQLPTVLSTAVEGGNPPDLAVLPQPGLARDFFTKKALQPVEFAKDTLTQNFSEDWLKLGTFGNQMYGVPFKGANKSTVWFNVQAFTDAGVEPPTTWEEFLQAAETLKSSGVPAYSIAGADGWTLTDLFENIYLRTAGPEKYDQLAEHKIPWTDESVTTALKEMQKVFQDSENIAGGNRGALQVDFPKSVSQVFADPPKAAMVMEGDFVGGVIKDSTDAQPGEGYDVFPFPTVGESGNAVVGGGDMVVMFKDSPGAQALVKYLGSAEAAEIWAKRGGFASPNKNVEPAVYPDDLTRKTASALAEAETFRFDMSDLAPADFGGTPGQGEWKILQDFLRNPDDVEGTASDLERAAKRAFK